MPPPRTPLPLVPAEAEHAQRAVAFGAADQADDLGGADVEHAERAAALMPRALRVVRAQALGGSTRRAMSFIGVEIPSPLEGEVGRRVRISLARDRTASLRPVLKAERETLCCDDARVMLLLRHVASASPAVSASSAGRGRSTSTVRQTHVDRASGRSSSSWCCSSCDQPVERGDLVALRQHHVDADVHLQVPAPLADPHRGHHALLQVPGRRVQRVDQRRGAVRRARRRPPAANWRKSRHVLVAQRPGRRGRSARTFPGSARSRTAGVPGAAPRWCRAAGARPSRDRPRTASRSAARACSTEKPRIGSPTDHAERGAQQRLRRVGAAFDDDVAHPQAGEAGRVAQPLAHARQRAAGRGRMHSDRSATARATGEDQAMPAGRSSRRCRRSSSLSRAGRSLTELRWGARPIPRGMRVLHHPGAELRESSCRDAPPVPAAARSASGPAAC